MTKRKKPEPKPTPPAADIVGDHSATLARDEHPFLADGVIEMPESEPIARIGSANAVIACPTCGTTKTGNRCDVCGHQERDT